MTLLMHRLGAPRLQLQPLPGLMQQLLPLPSVPLLVVAPPQISCSAPPLLSSWMLWGFLLTLPPQRLGEEVAGRLLPRRHSRPLRLLTLLPSPLQRSPFPPFTLTLPPLPPHLPLPFAPYLPSQMPLSPLPRQSSVAARGARSGLRGWGPFKLRCKPPKNAFAPNTVAGVTLLLQMLLP